MSAKHNAGIIGLNVIDDIMHSVTRHVSGHVARALTKDGW